MFGTKAQQEKWLTPLLEGRIRSCFCMTEPDVASSDATNMECSIAREGSQYVVNGRKWWATGAGDPRCKLAIVMGRTPSSQRPTCVWVCLFLFQFLHSTATGRKSVCSSGPRLLIIFFKTSTTLDGARANGHARRPPGPTAGDVWR
jgi:alkylation response protein AidB-like acyl-CoA dehydrogenase